MATTITHIDDKSLSPQISNWQDRNSVANSSTAAESTSIDGNDQLPAPSPSQQEIVTELTDNELRRRQRLCFQKIAIAVVLVAFISFVISDSLTNLYIRAGITTFLKWIEENPGIGVIAFILVYFVATIFFIPASILTLGAGFVFSASFNSLWAGICLGTLAVFVGASAGAVSAFLLGRYLFRDSVERLSKKYSLFEALDNALSEKGLRIMCLLRLSPIIPFNVINYVLGVTGVAFWSYCLANFAILPGTVLYVFLGASAGSLAESANSDDSMTVTIIVVVVGVVFGVIAIAMTSYYARKELNQVVANRQADLELQQQDRIDTDVEEGNARDGN